MGDPVQKQLRDNQGGDQTADTGDGLAPGKRPLTSPTRGGSPNDPGKRTGTQDLKPAPGSPEEREGRKAKGAGKTTAPTGKTGGTGGTVKAGGAKGAGGGGGGGGGNFAADGGVLGDGIKAQLTTFNTTVKGNTDTVQQPPGTGGNPKKESEEDHGKKVEQYEDGVDGIADMIGDLDAFDDLCDACSDWGEDKGAQQTALGSIRASKAFHNLSQMWQGALDGGEDSPKMQAAFEREFTSRGFWGSTQKAYSIVREDAKRQAKEDADAAAAKKKAKDAKAKADKEAKDAADKAAGKANAPGGDGKSIDGGAGGTANVGGLNATVTADMAPMPNFTALSKVTDPQFSGLMSAADMHAGLFSENQQEGQLSRRNDQILQQLKLAGGGFKDGFLETAKWGIVAHFGDKLVGGAAEKLLGEKVPIVGPLIMIAMDPPWKGKYWADVGEGFSKGGHDFASFAKVFSADAFKSCHSAGDVVGVLCAKLADLFSGFYEIMKVVSKLVNTLSAVCLILGAVLIGIGCALAWLGIGAGLIAAGGWLVEAGEVLGDIGLALMPVCLALSAIALVFRTAAAYLVPADVYAEQLAAEGGAANEFGNQAGQRVGLATARAVEEATPNAPKPKTAADASSGGTAKTEGAAEAKQVEAGTKGTGDAMQKAADGMKEGGGHDTPKQETAPEQPKADPKPEVEHPADEAKAKDKAKTESKESESKETEGSQEEAKQEKEKQKDKEKEGEKDKADDKAKKESVGKKFAKALGHQLLEAVRTSASLGRNLGRLQEAVKGLGRLGDVKAASQRGLSRHLEGLEEHAKSAEKEVEALEKQAEESQKALDEALDELQKGDGTLSKEDVAALNKQVREAQESWGKATERAKNLKDTLEGAVADAKAGAEQERMPGEEEREGSSAEDEDGSSHSNERKLRKAEDELKETKKEISKVKKENAQLDKEVADARKALEAAKAEKAQSEQEQSEAAKDPANAEKVDASKQVAEHEAAMEKAKEMTEKAGRIKSAEARRKAAEGALKKTVGKHVEVGGEPHKITSVGPEGVTVEPANGGPAKTVKPEEVKGTDLPEDFKAQVDKLGKAKADLETEMGDEKAPAGDYARRLEDNANKIRKEEGKRYSTPKRQAKWSQTKKAAAEWDAPGKKAESAVEEAQKEVDAKEMEAFEKRGEQKTLEDEAKELDNETAKLRRAKTDHRRTELQMEKGAELLAKWFHVKHAIEVAFDGAWELVAEGLEKAFEKAKEAITGHEEEEEKEHDKYAVLGLEEEGEEKDEEEEGGEDKAKKDKEPGDESEEEEKETETKAAKEPGGEPTEPGKEEKDKKGEKEEEEKDEEEEKKEELMKLQNEAKESGAKEAMFEELLALRPPTDIALLGDHRKKAVEAAAKAKDSHAWAYKCYQAELTVTKLAEGSQQMAESGKPMHKRAQEMKAPIEKSKSDERERASQLGGAEPGEIKGADGQMGGLVVQLISKLADHSDRLSQKPDGGGVKGEEMAGSQDKAAQQGQERSQQSKSHSAEQQQFLDQALELRARQEASVAKNIQSLEGKSREELGIRDEIRVYKAQALADENEAREEAERESGAFNEGWSRAATWQEAFEAKRKAMKDAGKGGGGE